VADVFISYSSQNRQQAAEVAQALHGLGLDVWWDRELVVGQAYDQAIERALDGAACVVVLWSEHAVASEWVRNEAAAGLQRGVLVPANLDGVKLPLEFRRRQTADLSHWAGDVQHEGFQALHRAIVAVVQPSRPLGEAGQMPQRGVAHPLRATQPKAVLAALLFFVVAGLGILLWSRQSAPLPPALPPTVQAKTEPQAELSAPNPGHLADAVVGEYLGDVVSDSQGSSRSQIKIVVEKLGASRVRITSPYARIGVLEVELTQAGRTVVSAEGSTTLLVELDAQPRSMGLSPRGELTYMGLRVN
jgi:hypothetical protein